MTTRIRNPGEFCWINMLTPQPAEACTFFEKLLGWTYAEMPGMGYLIKVGGSDIGGLFDLNSPQTPKGTPPLIGVMVKVENADATGEKISSLGGKAEPAFDIPDHGRMAVCHDPNGAQFDIWQGTKSPGTDVDGTLHGAPSWFETLTSDVARARKFYTGLFGWSIEEKPMPGFTYTTFKLGNTPVAGLMQIPEDMKAPPHWGVYFTVDDADQVAGQATKLGGKICMPLMDIPEIGRMAGITSPQGVNFYVIKYAMMPVA
jgi:uncharacterized protein